MFILNATRNVKSLLTDRGDMLTIKPGELSKLMVASRNLIISAINLGTPDEIGIIISGSYEMEVAKNITGSVPYLYTSVDEAKAKLIDPNIDYQPKLEESNQVNKLNEQLKQKDQIINELTEKVNYLNKELSLAKADQLKDDLEIKNKDLESKNKELLSNNVRLQSTIDELSEQVKNLTSSLNSTRAQLGERIQEQSSQSQMIDKLSEQLKEKTAECENLKDEYEHAPKQDYSEEYEKAKLEIDKLTEDNQKYLELNKTLRDNLKESSEIIDNMKSQFNAACDKFGLYLDDNNEWQQELPSKAKSEE